MTNNSKTSLITKIMSIIFMVISVIVLVFGIVCVVNHYKQFTPSLGENLALAWFLLALGFGWLLSSIMGLMVALKPRKQKAILLLGILSIIPCLNPAIGMVLIMVASKTKNSQPVKE